MGSTRGNCRTCTGDAISPHGQSGNIPEHRSTQGPPAGHQPHDLAAGTGASVRVDARLHGILQAGMGWEGVLSVCDRG